MEKPTGLVEVVTVSETHDHARRVRAPNLRFIYPRIFWDYKTETGEDIELG